MAPKVVDKAKRKREIALCALGVFAQRGFEAASMSQVAEAAGIGKGTIYEYFSSKDELIDGALRGWMEQMMEGLEALAAEEETAEARLRTMVRGSLEMTLEDPMMTQLMIAITQLMFEKGVDSFRFLVDGLYRMRKDLVGIVLEGISQGEFRVELAKDAEKLVINLLAYLDGIGMHYMLYGEGFDLLGQVNFYMDNLLARLRVER